MINDILLIIVFGKTHHALPNGQRERFVNAGAYVYDLI